LHGYEIEYIFGVPWLQEHYFDADDRFVSRKVMNYWANFAKLGRLYSEYETPTRKYLVLFSPANFTEGIAPAQIPLKDKEDYEYEYFNRNYENCDYLNSLNRYQSYATKYEMCLNYKEGMLKASEERNSFYSSRALSSASSFFILPYLTLILILLFFLSFVGTHLFPLFNTARPKREK